MNWLRECVVKRAGLGLAVWTLAFGIMIPVLDRDLFGADIAIEAEHHEACALATHDHTICSQYGKQPWAKPTTGVEQIVPPAVEEWVSKQADGLRSRRQVRPTNPRAPPSL